MPRLNELFGCDAPVVLVTGSGAARVGNAVIHEFAEHGYRCVVHCRTSANAAKETVRAFEQRGVETLAVQADLTIEQELNRMFEEVMRRFQRLDVLVNCSAIWRAEPLETTTAQHVRENFELNTLATFLTCQAAGKIMIPQSHGGAIVNLGDWATVRPYLNYAAYFASKGSIPTITRDFAVELAARNPRIRVNAVLPGPVMLPPDLPAHERAEAIAGTLLKREGSPTHVAQAVRFLAENDFITGVCLPVDGGRTIAS